MLWSCCSCERTAGEARVELRPWEPVRNQTIPGTAEGMTRVAVTVLCFVDTLCVRAF
jgi:hypothetical protein